MTHLAVLLWTDSILYNYVSVSVWGPDRGGVFQLWSYKCFVCCGFKVLVMDFDVAFDKTQRSVCFFGYVV